MTVERGADRSYKEDLSRLTGEQGTSIIYKVPGKLESASIYAFDPKGNSIWVLGSNDGENFELIQTKREVYANVESNYGYIKPILYRISGKKSYQYLRLDFKDKASLGRIEINYTDFPTGLRAKSK